MKKIVVILFLICICGGTDIYGQANDSKNKPSKTNSTKPLAEGKNVWGVFEGRVFCQEMGKVMNIPMEANCEKLKWAFTFFQNPETHEPTTYKWQGSLYREKAREGKWIYIKGTNANPDATVIQIDPDKPEQTFYILKGDDNVLFILDKGKALLVGDDYLSYTFNRVVN